MEAPASGVNWEHPQSNWNTKTAQKPDNQYLPIACLGNSFDDSPVILKRNEVEMKNLRFFGREVYPEQGRRAPSE